MRPAKFAIAISMLILSACGSGPTNEESNLNVINGKTVLETDHPAVYSIGGCTATFVSDSTMVTAGHCVSPGGRISLRNRSKATSTKIIRNPRYTGVGLQDTAIVLFAPGTSQHWLPIQKQAVAQNDDVLIVGYGCTLSSGASGKKRIGSNKIDRLSNGVIHLRRSTTSPEGGTDATLCPGDSGGPLLKGNTIVGIASYWDGGAGRSSGHADLTNKANQDFLNQTLEQGAKINFVSGNNSGPNSGGSVPPNSTLALALDEGSARVVGGAPIDTVQMRICEVATGLICESNSVGAIESSARRTTSDRSLHDFVGFNPKHLARYVLVALDSSGQVLARQAIQLTSR